MTILKIGPYMYVSEPKFYTGTFDILVFNVILGSFGALVSKWPVSQKHVFVEKNSEIWKLVVAVNMYTVYVLAWTL